MKTLSMGFTKKSKNFYRNITGVLQHTKLCELCTSSQFALVACFAAKVASKASPYGRRLLFPKKFRLKPAFFENPAIRSIYFER